jgi:hypothetical protein
LSRGAKCDRSHQADGKKKSAHVRQSNTQGES